MSPVAEVNLILAEVNSDCVCWLEVTSEEGQAATTAGTYFNQGFACHLCDLRDDTCCVVVELDGENLFSILFLLQICQHFPVGAEQGIPIVHSDPIIILVHKADNLVEGLPQVVSGLFTLVDEPVVESKVNAI